MKIGSSDDLAMLETVELERMQTHIKERINHARRNRQDSIPFEIDLTYVQRELTHRAQREAWVAKNLKD